MFGSVVLELTITAKVITVNKTKLKLGVNKILQSSEIHCELEINKIRQFSFTLFFVSLAKCVNLTNTRRL